MPDKIVILVAMSSAVDSVKRKEERVRENKGKAYAAVLTSLPASNDYEKRKYIAKLPFASVSPSSFPYETQTFKTDFYFIFPDSAGYAVDLQAFKEEYGATKSTTEKVIVPDRKSVSGKISNDVKKVLGRNAKAPNDEDDGDVPPPPPPPPPPAPKPPPQGKSNKTVASRKEVGLDPAAALFQAIQAGNVLKKAKATVTGCPVSEEDEKAIAGIYQRLTKLDVSPNLIGAGFNPIDVALMSEQERKSLWGRVRKDPNTPRECFTPEKRRELMLTKKFLYVPATSPGLCILTEPNYDQQTRNVYDAIAASNDLTLQRQEDSYITLQGCLEDIKAKNFEGSLDAYEGVNDEGKLVSAKDIESLKEGFRALALEGREATIEDLSAFKKSKEFEAITFEDTVTPTKMRKKAKRTITNLEAMGNFRKDFNGNVSAVQKAIQSGIETITSSSGSFKVLPPIKVTKPDDVRRKVASYQLTKRLIFPFTAHSDSDVADPSGVPPQKLSVTQLLKETFRTASGIPAAQLLAMWEDEGTELKKNLTRLYNLFPHENAGRGPSGEPEKAATTVVNSPLRLREEVRPLATTVVNSPLRLREEVQPLPPAFSFPEIRDAREEVQPLPPAFPFPEIRDDHLDQEAGPKVTFDLGAKSCGGGITQYFK